MIIDVDDTLVCPEFVSIQKVFQRQCHHNDDSLYSFVYTVGPDNLVSWLTADIAMNDGELLITCSNYHGINLAKHSSMFRISEQRLWISGELYDRIIGWVASLGR